MTDSICVFGDSIMKGVIFNNVCGRYTILKNSFAEIFSRNAGIPVDNYSKFGCTVTTGKKLIEKHALKLSSYKYTMLEFGGNDCNMDWASVSMYPDAVHSPKTPIADFEDTYSRIIDTVCSNKSLPVLISLPPLDARKYFDWISRSLNPDNILHWLGDVDYIYRWQEMYNLSIIKLASAKQVPLVDIRSAFLENRNYETLYCEDGIHPSEAGHELISDVMNKSLSAIGLI